MEGFFRQKCGGTGKLFTKEEKGLFRARTSFLWGGWRVGVDLAGVLSSRYLTSANEEISD